MEDRNGGTPRKDAKKDSEDGHQRTKGIIGGRISRKEENQGKEEKRISRMEQRTSRQEERDIKEG
jgi:hypothetical protein